MKDNDYKISELKGFISEDGSACFNKEGKDKPLPRVIFNSGEGYGTANNDIPDQPIDSGLADINYKLNTESQGIFGEDGIASQFGIDKDALFNTVSDLVGILVMIKLGFFATKDKDTKNHCLTLISVKRLQLKLLMASNKNVEHEIKKIFNDIYKKSIEKINGIVGLGCHDLPFFTFENLLDDNYWPDFTEKK